MKDVNINAEKVFEAVMNRTTTKAEAMEALQISRGTFYKRYKKYLQTVNHKLNSKISKKALRHKIFSIVVTNPKLGPKAISKKLDELGFTLSVRSVWLVLIEANLNTVENRQNFSTKFRKPKKITKRIGSHLLHKPETRREFIEKVINGEARVLQVEADYKVSRKTYSKWKKRYLYSDTGHFAKLNALSDRFKLGSDHPRGTSQDIENRILNLIIHSPELSTHKIAEKMRIIGNHGVQNVLARNGLNLMEHRVNYATSHTPQAVPAYTYITDRVKSVFEQFVPNTAPAPPPALLKFAKHVLLTSFASFLVVFTTLQITSVVASANGPFEIFGYMLSVVALLSGTFFFLYSFKYYLMLALVLSYSRQEGASDERTTGSIIDRFFGLRKSDDKNTFEAKSDILNPDLSSVKLNRYPYISVQIPFFNEKHVAERSIKAAISFEYDGDYEVMVCDDSTDETTDIVRKYQESFLRRGEKAKSQSGDGWTLTSVEVKPGVTLKHLHRTSRSGYKGAALGVALKLVDKRTEFVGIFDADFVPYPDSLYQFLKYFKVKNKMSEDYTSSKIAAVQGYQWHVLNKSENWITRGVRTEYSGSYVVERTAGEIYGALKQISGSVYLIRRDALEDIGWGTSITEDFQLTLKLYAKGYKVVFTPYIQAPAECVSTIKRLIKQRMRWAEGHSFNVRRHYRDILGTTRTTPTEKFEFVYLIPYYLQSFFFLVGTLSWFVAETIFQVRLPFWTALWGWSLVLTNMLSLPLMNVVGMFLEESEEKDYMGIFSFLILTYVVAPFQAYAAVKGLVERAEGPWFRTPKSGKITDIFKRRRFYRWLSDVLPTGSEPAVNLTVPRINLPSIQFKFMHSAVARRRLANATLGVFMSIVVLLFSLSPYIVPVTSITASQPEFRPIQQSVVDDKGVREDSSLHIGQDESLSANLSIDKDKLIRNAVTRDIDTPRNVIKNAKDGRQIEYIFHKEPRVRIKINDSEIEYETISIAGKPVEAQKSLIFRDKEVLYVDVVPGIDIKYTLNSNLITEEYILKNREAAGFVGDIKQNIKVNGIEVVSPAEDSFGFYFKDGTEAIRFGDPFAKDADGEIVLDINMSLEKTTIGHTMTKSLGNHATNWLSDSDRKFPVSIDPTVVVSGGVDETETQFGSLQRKIAYVSSNWYAFYNVDGKVYYKKSADGITWGDPVDLDSTDSDNYNTSISVSTTAIFAFWVDNGADRIEGRRIDTSSSDTLGTLCQTSVEAGAIDDSFMVSVAGLSTTAAVVAYSDTDADTEVNAFSLVALGGSCTGNSTSITTGNIVFGSGLSSLDRPVLVPVDTDTVDVIFQDGNLSYSRYILSANEWIKNNITVASVTHTIYSVTGNGTTTWVLVADTTQSDEAFLYSCCTDDISSTQIDADAGSNGQDTLSDIDIFCVSDTDCKLVYTDNIDSAGSQDLVFVDCDDATCSTSQSFTLDDDIDGDTTGTDTVSNPAIFCTSTDDCKVVYQDTVGDGTPDAVFFDCDDAEGTGDGVPCDDSATANILDSDIGSSTTSSHFDIYCVTETECAALFYEKDQEEGLMFVDCEADGCAGASRTVTEIIDITVGSEGPLVSIYCPTVTTCKVVAQDTDAGSLVFINCADGTSAANDEKCIGITPDTLDASVGTSPGSVPVSVDCIGGEADCRVVYGDDVDDDLTFLDCNDTDCNAPSTTTDIDVSGGATGSSATSLNMHCPAKDNCKILYSGTSTALYLVDCDNDACSAGSVISLEYPVSGNSPRAKGSIHCPSSANCKMAAYEGTGSSNPTVNFYDCDNEGCLPTSSDLADPWTGETNLTGVSLTYDSTNSDLIASAIMDSSEQAYFRISDAASISWNTEYPYGFTAGNLGHISAPYSVAGLSQMGVVVRQGTNFEFSTLPENLWSILVLLPFSARVFRRYKRRRGCRTP